MLIDTNNESLEIDFRGTKSSAIISDCDISRNAAPSPFLTLKHKIEYDTEIALFLRKIKDSHFKTTLRYLNLKKEQIEIENCFLFSVTPCLMSNIHLQAMWAVGKVKIYAPEREIIITNSFFRRETILWEKEGF